MSMGMHVVGIREPDEKWRLMKAAYDVCQAAGIEIPDSVQDFFGYEPPDDAGLLVDLAFAREWRDDSREGLEIDISELPAKITKLRFYFSW